MKKRISLRAIVLLGLFSASPVQAFDWFDSLFGPGSSHPPGVDPTMSTLGNETILGPGGGHPGVDPD